MVADSIRSTAERAADERLYSFWCTYYVHILRKYHITVHVMRKRKVRRVPIRGTTCARTSLRAMSVSILPIRRPV